MIPNFKITIKQRGSVEPHFYMQKIITLLNNNSQSDFKLALSVMQNLTRESLRKIITSLFRKKGVFNTDVDSHELLNAILWGYNIMTSPCGKLSVRIGFDIGKHPALINFKSHYMRTPSDIVADKLYHNALNELDVYEKKWYLHINNRKERVLNLRHAIRLLLSKIKTQLCNQPL